MLYQELFWSTTFLGTCISAVCQIVCILQDKSNGDNDVDEDDDDVDEDVDDDDVDNDDVDDDDYDDKKFISLISIFFKN